MRPSLKSALANAALVIVSLAVTYLAASFVIFRFLLPHLSLNLHPHFPDIAEVFAQTSKAGTVPRDYIALLGDSYAAGQGDGLLAANGDRAKFVHSAQVLHRLTGRDVVSLGLGGAGSVQAMVRQPARILKGTCFLYPRLDPPRQIVVYFYEGNDLDENGYIVGRVAGDGSVTRETIARYVADRYATPSWFRCFTDLGETTFKMAHFLITNAESFETLRKPSAHNKVLAGGAPHAAPALQKPPAERDPNTLEASFTVFDVSLEWLRQNFSAPVTVVYLPSPAVIYRHADTSVDVYTYWPLNEVRPMSAAEIYAASQRSCERIRALTLARDARFIDMRPPLRAAAASAMIHGPQDWNHFSAAGYRVLGEVLARTIDDRASSECRDW
ncbi:MAG: GDSL-type esterase/lipase family protein [Xanthobacteraceae bacterium]